MDNSRYYNDSLAYDFNMFMPKEKETPATVVKMPRKKTTPRKAAKIAVAGYIKSVVSIGFVLAIICANIFLRVKITEVNTAISDIKKEISELQSEETRLDVELENKISYKNIEEAAANLGMRKMDKSQVVYIRTNEKNAAKTSKGYMSAATN